MCNIGIGSFSLSSSFGISCAITGNIGLGTYALCGITCGSYNIAIGSGAACTVDTGCYNIAIGSCTLFAAPGEIPVACNIAIGANALASSTGVSNTVIGHCAGNTLSSGNCNVIIGSVSGATSTTGSNNVIIGAGATASSATVGNEVTITNGSKLARFQGAGASAWSFVSDARDKKNVQDLALGLDFVNALQPRKFEWASRDNDFDHGVPAAGFIAQEVLEVVEANNAGYSNLVNTCNPDQYTFAQANLVPFLVSAIKELSAKVQSLEDKLSALG
jgi:hypothetical protein